MLYPQNGGRIVAIDSVTSLHRMYVIYLRLSRSADWQQRSLYFSERVVNAWNSLPRDTNFNSVAGFKRSVAKVDFTTFLKGDFI